MKRTSILGINAYHGDSSACLVVDGQLVGAVEEERFRRVKHWAGFPSEAVRWCLAEGGIAPDQLDHVAVNRNPSANLFRKVLFAIKKRPSLAVVVDRLKNASRVRGLHETLAEALEVRPDQLRARSHAIEHHRAHLASAFLVSPFESAAIASVDGFGDFTSAMWGTGSGTTMTVRDRVTFPHSLGLYYLALTQYLGFPHYGDEYKVMGMAAYGEPRQLDTLRALVKPRSRGRFELDLRFFRHHSEGVEMSWEDGQPTIGRAYSDALVELLGPARRADEPLDQRHHDLAASIQALYEEAFFRILGDVFEATGERRLALAGGCAMNSLANGRIVEHTDFRDVYVQAAAGDAGGAVGAAFSVWNQELGHPRSYVMSHAYVGPTYDDDAIERVLAAAAAELEAAGCTITRLEDEDELCRRTAAHLAEGHVVGWFQGRLEWGPRALGNRSILGDPRRADMKDILNLKIKRRESFRPFAPSVLEEATGAWFELDGPVPFMSQVYPIREDRRSTIPAVTHADGTGRLQTVSREANPRYHRLIEHFHEATGIPMVLNTSFNENEPVVCRPEEALACFLRTKMDVLVVGDWMVER